MFTRRCLVGVFRQDCHAPQRQIRCFSISEPVYAAGQPSQSSGTEISTYSLVVAKSKTELAGLLHNIRRIDKTQSSSSAFRPRAQAPAPVAREQQSLDNVERKARREKTVRDVETLNDRQDLERQMSRKWKSGDVYAPHDLSGAEMSKWKQVQRKGRPRKDVFDMLQINPLDHYKV